MAISLKIIAYYYNCGCIFVLRIDVTGRDRAFVELQLAEVAEADPSQKIDVFRRNSWKLRHHLRRLWPGDLLNIGPSG